MGATMTQTEIAMPKQRVRRGRGHTYAMVVFLRRRGHRVYAAGRNIRFDGRLLDDRQLRAVAEAAGWRAT